MVLEGRLLPHFGYHVMLALAAGWSADPGRLRSAARVVLVLLVLAKLGVSLGFTRELLRSTGAALRPGPAIGLAVAFFLIAPLPRWGRLEHVYLGELSPTVWHNPTAIAALPFAVASFWLFLRAWPTPGGSRWLAPAGHRTAGLLLAGMLLAATTAIKPNFALAFVPVVVLLLLPSLDLFGMLAALAPASCLLVWQYIHALSSGLANDGLTTLQPLEVWSIYSPQPLVSALVSLPSRWLCSPAAAEPCWSGPSWPPG